MSLNYAAEKFSTAVCILATHTGGVIDRLESAYLDSLIRLEPEDIPDSLQSNYLLLMEKLDWLVSDEGSPPSPDEGSLIASSIYDLSFLLDEEVERVGVIASSMQVSSAEINDDAEPEHIRPIRAGKDE